MKPPADRTLGPGRTAIFRHPWLVRVTHWVNVVCLVVLVMSGLQILRAHPGMSGKLSHGSAKVEAMPQYRCG